MADRSVGCAGCGDCCERVVPTFTNAYLDLFEGHLTKARITASDRERWPEETEGRTYWERHAKAGRAYRDRAFYAKWFRPTGEVERQGDMVKQVMTCDAFDPVERRCTQHADRPLMCSEYPHYGRPAEEVGTLREDHCSYWWDAPVENRPDLKGRLIPLTVL